MKRSRTIQPGNPHIIMPHFILNGYIFMWVYDNKYKHGGYGINRNPYDGNITKAIVSRTAPDIFWINESAQLIHDADFLLWLYHVYIQRLGVWIESQQQPPEEMLNFGLYIAQELQKKYYFPFKID